MRSILSTYTPYDTDTSRYRRRQPRRHDPLLRNDAPTSRVSPTLPPPSTSLTLISLLRLDHHANQIAAAVYKVISEGKVRTPDMGGTSYVPCSPFP